MLHFVQIQPDLPMKLHTLELPLSSCPSFCPSSSVIRRLQTDRKVGKTTGPLPNRGLSALLFLLSSMASDFVFDPKNVWRDFGVPYVWLSSVQHSSQFSGSEKKKTPGNPWPTSGSNFLLCFLSGIPPVCHCTLSVSIPWVIVTALKKIRCQLGQHLCCVVKFDQLPSHSLKGSAHFWILFWRLDTRRMWSVQEVGQNAEMNVFIILSNLLKPEFGGQIDGSFAKFGAYLQLRSCLFKEPDTSQNIFEHQPVPELQVVLVPLGPFRLVNRTEWSGSRAARRQTYGQQNYQLGWLKSEVGAKKQDGSVPTMRPTNADDMNLIWSEEATFNWTLRNICGELLFTWRIDLEDTIEKYSCRSRAACEPQKRAIIPYYITCPRQDEWLINGFFHPPFVSSLGSLGVKITNLSNLELSKIDPSYIFTHP